MIPGLRVRSLSVGFVLLPARRRGVASKDVVRGPFPSIVPPISIYHLESSLCVVDDILV